jgi:hypothetical protein
VVAGGDEERPSNLGGGKKERPLNLVAPPPACVNSNQSKEDKIESQDKTISPVVVSPLRKEATKEFVYQFSFTRNAYLRE